MRADVPQSDARFQAHARVGEMLLDPFALLQAIRDSAGAVADFRYVYANEAASLRVTGGLVGRTLREVAVPDLLTELLDTYTLALEGGEVVRAQMGYRRDDDVVTWIALQASGIETDLIAVSWRDVSLQEQSDDRLRQWSTLFSATTWGIVVVADGCVQTCNRTYAAMHGYTPAELRGMPARELFSERARSIAPAHLERARVQGSAAFESEHIRKDGSTFPVEVRISVTTDERGEERYRIAHVQDISERKRAERELAEREERFSAAVDSMLDAFAILRAVRDDEGRIIDFVFEYVNDAACRANRRRRDELVGRRLRELRPREDAVRIFEDYASVVQSGRPLRLDTVDYHLGHEDYAPGVFDVQCVPFGTDRITVSFRDVTTRHRAEQALRNAEERFRMTFERAPAGMALLSAYADDYGQVMQVNETLCELTGLARDELLGSDLSLLTHRDDRARELELFAAVAAGEQTSAHLDVRMVRRDGQTRDVSIRLSGVSEHGSSPYVIKHVLDISERRRFEAQLQHLADHDALTGLFNRRRFGEELTRHLQLAARHDPTGALLLVDLDNFKYVNDTLGHGVGDSLIRDAAQLLRANLRATDTVARFGGDEFVVLLPDADADAALTTARHLGALFEASRPAGPRGTDGRTSLSIGVRVIDETAARLSWEHVVAEADIALYAAKEAGRNQVVLYSDQTQGRARMHERLLWSERLRTALDTGGLTLYAQPVVSLQGAQGPARYELLVRLRDPDGTVHEPSEFLPVARSFGMMRRLDREVITQAMRLAADRGDVHLAINVSADSVADPDLADFIADRAREHGVDPARLMFEITETDAIANLEQAARFADSLHALGATLALDDFGVGFGSFYYLKHLAVDVLKIDGGFIRQLCTDSDDQVMVQALVQAARGLGKETIAEWVGDEETMRRLTEYGVDWAQGFHVSRPLAPGGDSGWTARDSGEAAAADG